MFDSFAPCIGGSAAVPESLAYLPQAKKASPRGSTGDLSLAMFAALTASLSLWIVYGIIQDDWVIVCANIVGSSLSGIVLACKIRDLH